MHYYMNDSDNKYKIISAIVIISLILSVIINTIISSINNSFNNYILSYFPSLSIFSISLCLSPFILSSLIYIIYDRVLWKHINIYNFPNLNGNWRVIVKSKHDNFNYSYKGTAIIKQTYTKISILIMFKDSVSKSQSLYIINNSNSYEITYAYVNEPSNPSINTLNTHKGTCNFTYLKDSSTIKATYYTNKDRQGNYGEIIFKKISSIKPGKRITMC